MIVKTNEQVARRNFDTVKIRIGIAFPLEGPLGAAVAAYDTYLEMEGRKLPVGHRLIGLTYKKQGEMQD